MRRIHQATSDRVKSIGFDEEAIYISSKSHHDFDSLVDATVVSGVMESAFSVPLSKVSEIECNSRDEGISVSFIDESGKERHVLVDFESPREREPFVRGIAEVAALEVDVAQEGPGWELMQNGLAMAFTIAVTAVAVDLGPTEATEGSGRRRGAGAFIGPLIRNLDPAIICTIGAAVLAYFGYRAWNRYSNPGQVTTCRPASRGDS